MARGRRKTRTGKQTPSTFEKSPELEIAILNLQLHYLKTGRARPSMRDLLTEGIERLLEREGLPSMPRTIPSANAVISISDKKTVA